MPQTSITDANFYLLGYYVACLHRYEGYCEQYEDSEDELEGKAALSYLTSMCRNFKKLAEMVSRDLGFDYEDIDPDDRDAFLDNINEMEGRSPTKEFVMHLSPETAYRAFVMGDYIGSEIGFVHEYLKMLLPKIAKKDTRDSIVSVLDMKLRQFDEYMLDVPDALKSTVTFKTLCQIVDRIRSATPEDDETQLRKNFEEFFGIYSTVTDHYLSVRSGNDAAEDEEPSLYFISYARRNRGKANQVELSLLRENRRTWRDETDVRAGKKLLSSLYEGIDSADTFVCLLSESYLNSRWCMEELDKAIHRSVASGKPRIVALKIDTCDVPTSIVSRVWLDASSKEKLMLAMAQIIAEEETQ